MKIVGKIVKWSLISVVSIVVLVVGIAYTSEYFSNKPKPAKADVKETSQPVAITDVKSAVVAAVGSDAYKSHEVVGGVLEIYVNLTENLTQTMMLKGAQLDAFEIGKAVKSYVSDENATGILIVFMAELTDTYGNKSDDPVVKVGFTLDTLNKINFANVSASDVPTIADSYWKHPTFK